MTEPSQYFKGRTVQEQMNEVIGYVDTRSAEVAVNAIAADVAQVHQDMLDADADASAAAASAAAAAGTLANAVKKTGEASQSIAGDIAISGDAGVQGQLSVLGGCDLRAPVKIPVTPTNDDDAASKKYVDDRLDGYLPMVRTTGNQTKTGILTLESSTGGQIVQKTTNAGFDYGGANSYVPVSFNKVTDRNGNVVLDSNVSSTVDSRYQRTVLRQKVGEDVYELLYDLIINNNGDATMRLIKTLNGSVVTTRIITTL